MNVQRITYQQEPDSCADSDLGTQSVTLEIMDSGAGPYLVISTERWAMDAKDIDALAGKARGLLRDAEKAHAAAEVLRRAA